MSWTLQHGETTQTLEAWGLSGAVISQNAQEAGEFTATLAGDMLTDVPWGFQDAVIIRRDDVVVFRGWAMPILRSGSGVDEKLTVRFADSWYWFTRGQATQENYSALVEGPAATTRLALFTTIAVGSGWSLASVGSQIAVLVAMCNTYHGGGKMQLGTLSGDGFAAQPPPVEFNNGTFESALRACLAWVPDAVQLWDHTTSPPTLHLTQRAAATPRALPFSGGDMVSRDIKPMHDQVVDGVVLSYIYLNAIGQVAITVDAAGETTGNIIAQTIDITGGGAEPTYVEPVVESQSLKSVAIDPASASWWFKYGDTGAADVGDILVVGAASNVALDPNAEANEGHTGLDGCNKWLVQGSIPKWLDEADHLRGALVTGYLTVKVYPVAGNTNFWQIQRRMIVLSLPTTDLGTNTYTRTLKEGYLTTAAGSALATIPPAGVAASLLAVWGELQYSGVLTLTAEECPTGVSMGEMINLTGGLEEWETMNAQVQGLTHDIDNGTTVLTLGPSERLSPQDFLSLIKVMRVGMPMDLNRRAGI